MRHEKNVTYKTIRLLRVSFININYIISFLSEQSMISLDRIFPADTDERGKLTRVKCIPRERGRRYFCLLFSGVVSYNPTTQNDSVFKMERQHLELQRSAKTGRRREKVGNYKYQLMANSGFQNRSEPTVFASTLLSNCSRHDGAMIKMYIKSESFRVPTG